MLLIMPARPLRLFALCAFMAASSAASAPSSTGKGVCQGHATHDSYLEEVGLGMGGGGLLGTIFGGFHGAVLGGAIGGAAGFVDTLRRRGKDLTLPSGTELKFQLTRDLVIQR